MMSIVGAFGFTFNCSMSGSSNDHLRRAGDRPSDSSDIFRTLSPRQLLLLYGVLTNNNLRPRFMDELQDIVVANADSIVSRRPTPEGHAQNLAEDQLETSRFLNRSNTLQTSGKQHSVESECGHLCDTTAATATSTKKPSEF